MNMARRSLSPIRRAFGDKIRQLRTERGLSQEALADLAKLHRTYVGSIERGERNISLDNIAKLAIALDVPICTIFKNIRASNGR
jgi:transcriptional regulator with XRE-family HTH domain